MSKKDKSFKDKLDSWWFYHQYKVRAYLGVVLVVIISGIGIKSRILDRNINLDEFTEEVEVLEIRFEKINHLPDFYSTKVELDKY